jgi:hypothetical protein
VENRTKVSKELMEWDEDFDYFMITSQVNRLKGKGYRRTLQAK